MQKIVVFDVDDTLYDQLLPFQEAIDLVFPEVSQKVQPHFLYILFRQVSDEVFPLYTSGTWSLEKMRYERINQTIEQLHFPTISQDKASAFQKTYEKTLSQIALQPDMKEILQSLKAKKVSMAIITNGPTSHQTKKIQQLGLEQWIPQDKWFISESTGFKKPEKEIFQLVSEKFEDSNAEFLYVGDSFENDVEGCYQANWSCIWLNHRKRECPTNTLATPTYTLESFSEVATVINQWLTLS